MIGQELQKIAQDAQIRKGVIEHQHRPDGGGLDIVLKVFVTGGIQALLDFIRGLVSPRFMKL